MLWQIDFLLKVFLRPYISRVRMFAIKILLVGVLFVAILAATPIFQVRRYQKIKIHIVQSYFGTFAYFLSAFVNLVSLKV